VTYIPRPDLAYAAKVPEVLAAFDPATQIIHYKSGDRIAEIAIEEWDAVKDKPGGSFELEVSKVKALFA
jgi:hypothetical protein